MRLVCPQCGIAFERCASHANRSIKIGAPLYCGKVCAGIGRRRVELPEAERKAAKAAYDRKRREEHGERIRAEKLAAYYANHEANLAKSAVYRKTRMPKHVEYCRQPEYKAWKHEYDIRRGGAEYQDFAEAWRLLLDLEKEIRSQASAYERRVANGYYTRSAQQRRRDLWQAMQRN